MLKREVCEIIDHGRGTYGEQARKEDRVERSKQEELDPFNGLLGCPNREGGSGGGGGGGGSRDGGSGEDSFERNLIQAHVELPTRSLVLQRQKCEEDLKEARTNVVKSVVANLVRGVELRAVAQLPFGSPPESPFPHPNSSDAGREGYITPPSSEIEIHRLNQRPDIVELKMQQIDKALESKRKDIDAMIKDLSCISTNILSRGDNFQEVGV